MHSRDEVNSISVRAPLLDREYGLDHNNKQEEEIKNCGAGTKVKELIRMG